MWVHIPALSQSTDCRTSSLCMIVSSCPTGQQQRALSRLHSVAQASMHAEELLQATDCNMWCQRREWNCEAVIHAPSSRAFFRGAKLAVPVVQFPAPIGACQARTGLAKSQAQETEPHRAITRAATQRLLCGRSQPALQTLQAVLVA